MAPGEPDDPNVVVVRNFLDALDRGDAAAARALLAPDVVQRVPGRSALAGTYRGPDAVLAADARLRTLADGGAAWRPMIWLAAGEHSHVVGRLTATRAGRTAAFDRALVFRLAGGRIAELRAYEDDQYAFDAFFAPAD